VYVEPERRDLDSAASHTLAGSPGFVSRSFRGCVTTMFSSGHGFSRAAPAEGFRAALAAEGWFSQFSHRLL
jgi:hypothetical protein